MTIRRCGPGRCGSAWAITITALLFGLSVLGVPSGLMFQYTRSLLASSIFHVLWGTAGVAALAIAS